MLLCGGCKFEPGRPFLPSSLHSSSLLIRPMASDASLYARKMYEKGYGRALWLPEPQSNRPAYLSRGGVSVGDVGYVTDDDSFETLFNVLLEGNHPANCRASGNLGLQPYVPDGFVPLALSQDDLRENPSFHNSPSVITSDSNQIRRVDAGMESAETMYAIASSYFHL
jgi:hypothetical protein